MKITDRKVHWITLELLPKDLERSFHSYYINRYLWQLRLTYILGIIFCLVVALSGVFLGEETSIFTWLKIDILLPSFILGYAISYIFTEFYKRYYQYFNIFFVLITAISFIFAGKNVPPFYTGTFYTGIIICFVFNYTLIRQSFIKSSLSGFIILIIYYIVLIASNGKFAYFLLSVYLTVVHFLGMFIAYLTEYENKRSYLLSIQTPKDVVELSNINSVLEKEVEKRTIEIENAKKLHEESEARLIDANKLAGLGYWIWDINSGDVKWSDEVFKIFGLDKESFIPQIDSIMKLSPWPGDNKRNLELINRATENKEKGEYEQKFLKPDNSVGYYRSTFIGSYNEKGELVTIKGTVIDITTIKKYELELIEKNHEYEALNEELRQINDELLFAKEKAEESNRLKTEFLHNMSHEIRTPMNGIVGFSEIITSPNITNEERIYSSRIIQNSSNQLLRIIDDILEISTLETKQIAINRTTFCINDLIMELLSVFNLKSKEQSIPIHVKKGLPDKQGHIFSDKTKITKVLSNLIENALKFTDEGSIEIGYYMEKDNLVIYVKDTGIGVSPENKEIIFKRFSQEDKNLSRKRGGLGLGLSIAKENVQLLGGDIKLESEKSKGSTFFITIPYKPAGTSVDGSSEPSPKRGIGVNNTLTILVAEDEEINYLYIETLLKKQTKFECNLFHAKNGKEAVDICLKNKNIDIVLMDIKMPIMNGYEATEKIKSSNPGIPIIAQTAYSTKFEKRLALKHGCNDFISKPIKKEELFDLVYKHLELK